VAGSPNTWQSSHAHAAGTTLGTNLNKTDCAGRRNMDLSAKASMDDTTPEALLQSMQANARWTPPWATTH
jgi:hypothetical protein